MRRLASEWLVTYGRPVGWCREWRTAAMLIVPILALSGVIASRAHRTSPSPHFAHQVRSGSTAVRPATQSAAQPTGQRLALSAPATTGATALPRSGPAFYPDAPPAASVVAAKPAELAALASKPAAAVTLAEAPSLAPERPRYAITDPAPLSMAPLLLPALKTLPLSPIPTAAAAARQSLFICPPMSSTPPETGARSSPAEASADPAVASAAPAPLPDPAALQCSLTPGLAPPLTMDATLASDPLRFGRALAEAAKAQTKNLVVYNAAYMSIAYPRGDVPAQFGVCTDVVIRAYRALGIDLQELVHETRPGHSDPSIDHRRTELLRQFFATHGEKLPITPFPEDYLPGDIVTYYRPQNRSSTSHIAVVTGDIAVTGRPMIAHNRGWGVQLEDALFVDEMTGHYRYRGPGHAMLQVAAVARSSAARVVEARPARAAALLRAAVHVTRVAAHTSASAAHDHPTTDQPVMMGLGRTPGLRH